MNYTTTVAMLLARFQFRLAAEVQGSASRAGAAVNRFLSIIVCADGRTGGSAGVAEQRADDTAAWQRPAHALHAPRAQAAEHRATSADWQRPALCSRGCIGHAGVQGIILEQTKLLQALFVGADEGVPAALKARPQQLLLPLVLPVLQLGVCARLQVVRPPA
jgi:hypothetical protein